MFKALKTWLPFALVITGLCGLVYVVGQQMLRQSANDPQIALSEDKALALANGAAPNSLVTGESVDISLSLATYTNIYSETGIALVGNGELYGTVPNLPVGVIQYAKAQGQTRFTWQPQPGVRSALVITRVAGKNNVYVAVGRSLREVEKREDDLFKLTALGWVTLMTASFLLCGWTGRRSR
ncbi:MAG TPA: hypothetical protein VLH19_00895 [Patescibacteria group bacterium]|nr:hypothetical protein [Patescibacteria group bacterium]